MTSDNPQALDPVTAIAILTPAIPPTPRAHAQRAGWFFHARKRGDMATNPWAHRRGRELREEHREHAQAYNLPCARCGHPIDYTSPSSTRWAYECGHKQPVSKHPDLVYEWDNLQAEHSHCNRAAGNRPAVFVEPHRTRHSTGWPGH